jgi:hypothetical protein
MSGQKADPELAEPEASDLDTLEALEARGDVDALLEAARTARNAKDMQRCLACYEAAARLGSGDGHYAAALFYLGGQLVPQDFKKGTAHLRAAAEAGILSAKVYMANLYELGIHYAPDAEKADVWYRNAARTAGIEEDDDYPRKMADLGSARHYLELASDEKTTDDERSAWAKKARALGYQLKTKSGADLKPGTAAPSVPEPEPESAPAPVAVAVPKVEEKKKPEKKEATKEKEWLTPAAGVKAFAVEVLFMSAALATGFLLAEGAKILIAQQGALPILGTHAERAYGIAIALIGVLPALLVYKARTVAASIAAGAVTALIGFWLHGSPSGTWLHPRPFQVLVFALAGFLGCALALGVLGGAKSKKKGARG